MATRKRRKEMNNGGSTQKKKDKRLQLEREEKAEQRRIDNENCQREREEKAEQRRTEEERLQRETEERWTWEERKWIMEKEQRDAKARIEQGKEERAEEERQQMYAREKEREAKLEIEREERDRKERVRTEEQQSKPARLQRAAKKLEKIIPKMTALDIDMPIYFKTIEGYFRDFQIDEDLKIPLLLPHMNDKARRVVSAVNDDERGDYIEVKKLLLQAFQLTPRTYKTRFIEAKRDDNETWIQFANRLDCIFSYYLESRNVSTLTQLRQLMVSDKLKETMGTKLKEHILSKEGATWLAPNEVASAADLYIANIGDYKPTSGKAKITTSTYSSPRHIKAEGDADTLNSAPQNLASSDSRWKNYQGRAARGSYSNQKTKNEWGRSSIPRPDMKCFRCGGPHLARNCGVERRVNRVTLTESQEYDENDIRDGHIFDRMDSRAGESSPTGATQLYKNINAVSTIITDENEQVVWNQPTKTNQAVGTEVATFKVSVEGALATRDVWIELKDTHINCIVDSGADITVLRSDLVPKGLEEPRGRIRLRGAFGQVAEANILTLPMRLVTPDANQDAQTEVATLITVASTPMLDTGLQCLLTTGDLALLRQHEECVWKDNQEAQQEEIRDGIQNDMDLGVRVITNEEDVN